MNPLLITSALSLGHKIIDQVATARTASPPPAATGPASFAACLDSASPSELSQWMMSQRLASPADVEDALFHMKAELLHSAEAQDALAGLPPETPVQLKQDEHGRYGLYTGERLLTTLAPDSPVAALSGRIHQLETLMATLKATPEATVSQIAARHDLGTLSSANWVLRA